MLKRLERYFEFDSLRTNWRTEILAGFTTFMTMAYIVFVNPAILSQTGMPRTAVAAATCLAAAAGSILMGVFARYPIALAPGMGLNAYFTYTVVLGMGMPWQTALGAVFISGILFLVVAATGLRRLILSAFPPQLLAAIAVGIGLFLALIGFRNAGIIVPDAASTVQLGNLGEPQALLALLGLFLMSVLTAWRVRAAILLGILATTLVGVGFGLTSWTTAEYSLRDLSATALRFDWKGALRLGALEIIFVFLFVDLFDNLGTLVGVCRTAGISEEPIRLPRIRRILLSAGGATVVGAMAGTSTVCSYVESAAGVAVGGKTGVPALVSGLLFLVALFLAPMAGVVPAGATAPALILVGCLMAAHAREIDWDDATVAIPAFLTMTLIPLTFSIANGLAAGFIAYVMLCLVRGERRRLNWLAYVLAAILVARFVFLQHLG